MESRKRWQTPVGKQLAEEVWRRLVAKEPLHDLPLGEYQGHIDLRGISVPEVTKQAMPPVGNWSFHKLNGWLEFRNVHFADIDFSDSDLKHIRFFNSRITGCLFNDVDCEDWSIKATDVIHTTFVGASLRDALIGPWYEGRGNRYEFVDFNRADMRGLVSPAAIFVDCDFSYAKLDKVEFQSSSFIRCRFAGEVREVIFYDHGFKTGKPDPNPMEDVDFSGAQLRWVAFRRLNLDRVKLPHDEDHLIFKNYRCVLERALLSLTNDETPIGKALNRVLANYFKWIGPRQNVGVFNRLDFRETWGETGEKFVVGVLLRAQQRCQSSPHERISSQSLN